VLLPHIRITPFNSTECVIHYRLLGSPNKGQRYQPRVTANVKQCLTCRIVLFPDCWSVVHSSTVTVTVDANNVVREQHPTLGLGRVEHLLMMVWMK
jgi:hypothetical protein